MEVSTLDWLDPTKFFSVSSFLWASIDVYCDRQAAGCFWLPRRFLLHKMFKYLNKHKELIPLFVCVGAGCFGATFYLARLALKNPDCSWDRKNNPHPWLHIKPQQNIKFVSVNDWSNRKDPRPEELRNL